MRLVILEGADGVGKSTAIANLDYLFKDQENVKFFHVPKPAKDLPMDTDMFIYWRDLLTKAFSGYELTHDTVFIMDRSPVGNLIYGKRKKDQPYLSYEQLVKLFDWLAVSFHKVDAVLLHCSDEVLKKRVDERGDDYIKSSELVDIQKDYLDIWKKLDRNYKIRGDIYFWRAPKNGSEPRIVNYVQDKLARE